MQSLQTDSQYLLYWIYIGRGMSEEDDRFGENHGGSRIDYVRAGKPERTD
ncbi:hypothetical protein KEH51_23940 [[Brevibacterium] frigoritolerans]|uniref:Uncharacterized protein n=1 Tax=Peribacillus frigoritolerans TaxID=450367 RepID=A0A941FN97_9BACI|nr:hypothetical protein [Peribacillus frigoritolerans]